MNNINLLDNIERKDLLYFTKIFYFVDSLVPIRLGKWKSNVKVYDARNYGSKEGIIKPSKASESIVTFQEIHAPSEVKYFSFFRDFKYVKAIVGHQKALNSKMTSEETVFFDCGLTEEIIEPTSEIYLNKREVLLIRAAEVIVKFVKKYNLSLYSLKYFCNATPLTSSNYVVRFAREMIKSQVQINYADIYDNIRLSFRVDKSEEQYCEKYLLFDYVVAMYAFAQIHLERKFNLPNKEACIIFKDGLSSLEEKSLELMFFDNGIPLEDKKIPLKDHPEYPYKIKNTLLLIKRKNNDLLDKIERLKAQYIHSKIKGVRYSSEDIYARFVEEFMKKTANEPSVEVKSIAEDIQNSYIYLVNLAKQNKEVVLNKIEEERKLQRSILIFERNNRDMIEKFIKFNSNIEGLPAHFASIPIGYCQQQNSTLDPELGEVIKIERKPLIYKGQPLKDHEPLIIELNTDRFIDEKQNEIIEYVNLIFGQKPCPGFFLQGLIALFRIYDQNNGFRALGKKVKITFEDFIDTIRPNRAKRQRAFGHEKDPKEIFRAVCEIQDRLYYRRTQLKESSIKRQGNYKDTIRGFFKILRDVKRDKYEYYNMVFNEDLFSLINLEQGNSPLFMPVNAKAMLSYEGQSLDYLPAAQLSLELYAKENLYRKNRSTIFAGIEELPNGITRKAYMHRFGLLKGRSEDSSHLIKRLDRIWGNLRDHEVINSVKIDGREARDKLDTKLFVDMHSDYVGIMNITEKKQELKKLNSLLEAPLDINNLIKKRK